MGESNTVVSAYTMYRHLQQYCSHPSIYSQIQFDILDRSKHFTKCQSSCRTQITCLPQYHDFLFQNSLAKNISTDCHTECMFKVRYSRTKRNRSGQMRKWMDGQRNERQTDNTKAISLLLWSRTITKRITLMA